MRFSNIFPWGLQICLWILDLFVYFCWAFAVFNFKKLIGLKVQSNQHSSFRLPGSNKTRQKKCNSCDRDKWHLWSWWYFGTTPHPGFQSPPGWHETFLGSGIPTNKPSFVTIASWGPEVDRSDQVKLLGLLFIRNSPLLSHVCCSVVVMVKVVAIFFWGDGEWSSHL